MVFDVKIEQIVEKPKSIRNIAEEFCNSVPHNLDLGLKILPSQNNEGRIQLTPTASLVGDPSTGQIFNSVLLSMADACAGLTTYLNIKEPMPIATLDLRMDYLYPAPGDQTILCVGSCLRMTREIAFIRCMITTERDAEPIAIGNAVFMLGTSRRTEMPVDRGAHNAN